MHTVLISAFGGRKSVDIPAASKARVEGLQLQVRDSQGYLTAWSSGTSHIMRVSI